LQLDAANFARLPACAQATHCNRWDGRALQKSVIQSIGWVKATRPAYNLLIAPLETFLADGLLVTQQGLFSCRIRPCSAPTGRPFPISEVRFGRGAHRIHGRWRHRFARKVREVFTHEVEEYFVVATEAVRLAGSPRSIRFTSAMERSKTLDTLRVGDQVFAYDGRRLMRANNPPLGESSMLECGFYNLQTDAPRYLLCQRHRRP
jgi:hypothetical protein